MNGRPGVSERLLLHDKNHYDTQKTLKPRRCGVRGQPLRHSAKVMSAKVIHKCQSEVPKRCISLKTTPRA